MIRASVKHRNSTPARPITRDETLGSGAQDNFLLLADVSFFKIVNSFLSVVVHLSIEL